MLDEPTVSMDVEGRRDFWTAMRAYAARGKTVIFATHYLEEADANADRAVLMARGRIVADGPTTEIKARVILRCSDSDGAIRALLERHPSARDIEITGAGLEEAFLELTGEESKDAEDGASAGSPR